MMKAVLLGACLLAVTSAQKEARKTLPKDLEDQAQYQLYAAYGAYCKAKQIEDWECKWCKKMGKGAKVYGVVTKDEFDGQAFVVRDNKTMIIVSFRGSSNSENWVEDFTFAKVKLNWTGVPEGVEVHQGFYESYMSMRSDVMTWTKEAQKDCPTCTLHVTGHSLGAAEAQLCTMDFRTMGEDPMMWTFGQPRVGNKKYAEWFDTKTKGSVNPVFRMVWNKDPVPHLPPSALGFHHNAREVWHHSGNKSYIMCDNTGEDGQCSDSVPYGETDILNHLEYMNTHESC